MIKLLQHVPVVRRMFSPTMTGFLLFSSLARSEESPIWVNAKVLDTDFEFELDYSPKDNLINGGFKEIVRIADSVTRDQFIVIDQGKPAKLSRLYLQNRNDEEYLTFGNLHICMGNDKSSPTAPGNTCLTEPFDDVDDELNEEAIHEGGIFNLEPLPAARYVFIYR